MKNEPDLTFLREQNALLQARLSGGGGGSTYDPMEARVSALEETAKRIDGKLDKVMDGVSALGKDVGELKGRVSNLPTTWQMITLVLGIFGAAFAMLGVVYAILAPHLH